MHLAIDYTGTGSANSLGVAFLRRNDFANGFPVDEIITPGDADSPTFDGINRFILEGRNGVIHEVMLFEINYVRVFGKRDFSAPSISKHHSGWGRVGCGGFSLAAPGEERI